MLPNQLAKQGRSTLEEEQCRMLHAATPVSALTNLGTGGIAIWVLREAVPPVGLSIWALWLVLVHGARLGLWAWSRDSHHAARRAAWLRGGVFLSGSVWGALCVFFFPADLLQQTLLAFFIAGVSGAAVVGLAFDRRAALFFVWPALVPLMVRLWLQGSAMAHDMSVMAGIDLLYLSAAAQRGQRQFAQWLSWRNQAFQGIDQLAQQARGLERLARFNALLAQANQMGSTLNQPNALYEAVCHAAVTSGALKRAWIGRPDPTTGRFDILALAGAAGDWDGARISCRADDPAGTDPTGRAWRDDQAIFVAESPSGEPTHASSEPGRRYALGPFAALPVHAQDQVVAVLSVYFDEDEALDAGTREMLMNLVASIERGLQAIWQRHRIASLQKLYRALMSEGDVVLRARSAAEMLLKTCERLTEDTQFHAAWVARPDAQGHIEVIARAGSGAEQLDNLDINIHDENKSPLVIRVLSGEGTVYRNDLLGDPNLQPWFSSMARYSWHAALATAVRRGGAIWAVLVFVSPQRDAFDDQTIALCQRIAELLGHGLDELDVKERLRKLQREESHRARHDPLTHLPNRYALEQYLPTAMARARDQRWVLAVGMIDLDNFKPVNDTWGHDAGDRLLQELARRLHARVRETDFLARLGGDEFVVVIEQIDELRALHQLGEIFHRLHQAVESPIEIAPGTKVEINMTMGLALYPRDAEDSEALIRQADAAMYEAKLHKLDRPTWWQLRTPSAPPPAPGDGHDPGAQSTQPGAS